MQRNRRATVGAGYARNQEKQCSGFFYLQTKAIPRRQRHATRLLRRDVAHVEHKRTEASGAEQQIGGTQRLVKPRPRGLAAHRLSAHPKQAAQLNSQSCCREWIEGVRNIYIGTGRSGLRDAGQGRQRQRRASGRISARQLRDRPQRKSAAKRGIHLRYATGKQLGRGRWPQRKSRRNALDQSGFDLFSKLRCVFHFRFLFAIKA